VVTGVLYYCGSRFFALQMDTWDIFFLALLVILIYCIFKPKTGTITEWFNDPLGGRGSRMLLGTGYNDDMLALQQ